MCLRSKTMRSIIKEIREQPPHIRELFMWVCAVITFSIIGFAWFKSTTKQFVALLNPEQALGNRALAKADENKVTAPFATIFGSLKDLRANIFELFNLAKKSRSFEIENGSSENLSPVRPQKLPLSDTK